MSRRIMIVDDQVGIRTMLKMVFEEVGHNVMVAYNGKDALQKMEQFNPQLVLMDIRMPGIDGVETMLLMMKKDPQTKVILMTAYSDQEVIDRAKIHGAIDCLIKPFDVRHLRERVINDWDKLTGNISAAS